MNKKNLGTDGHCLIANSLSGCIWTAPVSCFQEIPREWASPKHQLALRSGIGPKPTYLAAQEKHKISLLCCKRGPL